MIYDLENLPKAELITLLERTLDERSHLRDASVTFREEATRTIKAQQRIIDGLEYKLEKAERV